MQMSRCGQSAAAPAAGRAAGRAAGPAAGGDGGGGAALLQRRRGAGAVRAGRLPGPLPPPRLRPERLRAAAPGGGAAAAAAGRYRRERRAGRAAPPALGQRPPLAGAVLRGRDGARRGAGTAPAAPGSAGLPPVGDVRGPQGDPNPGCMGSIG